MNIEKINLSDLDEISHLRPDGWPDIVPDIEFYIKSDFCYPLKFSDKNKIVGIGALITFKNTSWLAHIIVDPDFRNKGIGFKIVEELLGSKKNNSISSCSLLATDLGKHVYFKAGFRDVTEYCFLKNEKVNHAEIVTKNVMPFKEEHRSRIYKLDKQISGENREKLLDPYLVTSLVYIENKWVTGYYIPGLKEGLIYAHTQDAGLELMKIKYSKIGKASLPSDNIAGIEFLKQNGFIETEVKGTRMIRGKDIMWEPAKIFSRIGGNFG